MAKRGTCKICLNENVLMTKGHIIPDWIYRIGNLKENYYIPTKALQNRLQNVDVPKPTGSITSYLFCNDCDRWLGDGESEIRMTFLSPNSPTDPITSSVELIKFPFFEIDAPKIAVVERGIAGIIFKMQFMNNPLFRDCRLPKEKMKQYRKALDKNSPESDEFPFFDFQVIKLVDINSKGSAPMSYFTIVPYEDGTGVMLFLAGLCILVNFDSNEYFSLRQNKKVKVTIADIGHLGYKKSPLAPFRDFPNFRYFDNFQTKWINIAFFRTALNKYKDDDPCPCGLHWTKDKKRLHSRLFGNCCKPMWLVTL